LRTADVAANVCIRDERGAVVDPEQPVELPRSCRWFKSDQPSTANGPR